jgi:ankyrin repeat protein
MKRSPLHIAVLKDNYYLVDYLISCGANINCKDSDDNTPLHLSAKLGYEKLTAYLLCKNADYEIKNKYNEIPSDISCNYSIYKVINLIYKSKK